MALVFVGFNFLEAKKPAKPPEPEDKWGIMLPTQGEGYNMYGMEDNGDAFLYSEDMPYIVAEAERRELKKGRGKNRSTIIHYIIRLHIEENDQGLWWGLNNAVTYQTGGDTGVPIFNFPPGYDDGCNLPKMECFLNRQHPFSIYRKALFYFWLYVDIEAIQIGERVYPNHPNNRMDYDFWPQEHHCCLLPEETPYYSWILMFCPELVNSFGKEFFIERASENTWIFGVVNQEFQIKEYYCERETYAKGKRCGENIYYPYRGTTTMSFYVKLIKLSAGE
jgi:hypothetical protein